MVRFGAVKIMLAQLLLLAIILPGVYGVQYLQIGDTVGLPYPGTPRADIYMKEAYMDLQMSSSWEKPIAGYEPHHAVRMTMNSRYVLQNDGTDPVSLSVKLPLMVSLEGGSLSLALNSDRINYTGSEYANPGGAGTGFSLYTLNLTLPPGTNVLEVNATGSGIAGIESDLTVLLQDASRWPKPLERLVISTAHENGMIMAHSIAPSRTTLTAATWEFDQIPDEDLTLRWRMTVPPIGGGVEPSKISPADPLLPPIVAIVVGGAIIGFIAYVRAKRKAKAKIGQ